MLISIGVGWMLLFIYRPSKSFGHSSILHVYFSGLTREAEASIAEFMKNDGFSILLRAIQTNIEKLQTKAAFMISALCRQQPSLKRE